MSWLDTHSITDLPIAYRATRSCLVGDTNLAMVDADLSTVAVAKAAAVTNANAGYIGERFFGINTARGFQAASDMGGTFGSTFTALFASLPANPNGNKAMMISGS